MISPDFSRSLFDHIHRSFSIPGGSRSLEIHLYHRKEYQVKERTGEHITAIYYEHPSDLRKK